MTESRQPPEHDAPTTPCSSYRSRAIGVACSRCGYAKENHLQPTSAPKIIGAEFGTFPSRSYHSREARDFRGDLEYLYSADAHADEGPLGESAARSILSIALHWIKKLALPPTIRNESKSSIEFKPDTRTLIVHAEKPDPDSWVPLAKAMFAEWGTPFAGGMWFDYQEKAQRLVARMSEPEKPPETKAETPWIVRPTDPVTAAILGPSKNFAAFREDSKTGDPVGWGATEDAAHADLVRIEGGQGVVS